MTLKIFVVKCCKSKKHDKLGIYGIFAILRLIIHVKIQNNLYIRHFRSQTLHKHFDSLPLNTLGLCIFHGHFITFSLFNVFACLNREYFDGVFKRKKIYFGRHQLKWTLTGCTTINFADAVRCVSTTSSLQSPSK